MVTGVTLGWGMTTGMQSCPLFLFLPFSHQLIHPSLCSYGHALLASAHGRDGPARGRLDSATRYTDHGVPMCACFGLMVLCRAHPHQTRADARTSAHGAAVHLDSVAGFTAEFGVGVYEKVPASARCESMCFGLVGCGTLDLQPHLFYFLFTRSHACHNIYYLHRLAFKLVLQHLLSPPPQAWLHRGPSRRLHHLLLQLYYHDPLHPICH